MPSTTHMRLQRIPAMVDHHSALDVLGDVSFLGNFFSTKYPVDAQGGVPLHPVFSLRDVVHAAPHTESPRKCWNSITRAQAPGTLSFQIVGPSCFSSL